MNKLTDRIELNQSDRADETPYRDEETIPYGYDITLSAHLPTNSMGEIIETITLEEWKAQQ